MKNQIQEKSGVHPVEIGYYGRPITKLTKEELVNAIVELNRMYMELDRNFKNYRRDRRLTTQSTR